MPNDGNTPGGGGNPKQMHVTQRLNGDRNAVVWLATVINLLSLQQLALYCYEMPDYPATAAGNKLRENWSLDPQGPHTPHKEAYGLVGININNIDLLMTMQEDFQNKGKPLIEFLNYVRNLKRTYASIMAEIAVTRWKVGDDVSSFTDRIRLLFNELRLSHPDRYVEEDLCEYMIDNAPELFYDVLRTARTSRAITGAGPNIINTVRGMHDEQQRQNRLGVDVKTLQAPRTPMTAASAKSQKTQAGDAPGTSKQHAEQALTLYSEAQLQQALEQRQSGNAGRGNRGRGNRYRGRGGRSNSNYDDHRMKCFNCEGYGHKC